VSECRVAVVTGAASGLGLALAERFAADGMRVLLSDIETGPLEAAVRSLRGRGYDVRGRVTDVAQHEEVAALADEAFEVFGAVHVLCNNAGVVKRGRSWDLTLDDWRWVLDVDLLSVIYGVRTFLPRMIAQRDGGHVVNTASMAGLLPMPNLAAYSVAKAGVIALSESLQMDLVAEGSDIGVSVLCPGFIATRITESDRNRPTGRGEVSPPPAGPRTTAGVSPTMDAATVARHVADAIRDRSFWVLTHESYAAVIADRAAGIGAGGHPTVPPVW
jgi:NAD(P)-dependent dehydrogenase (short-subunit alcohol dehydrogenase family)